MRKKPKFMIKSNSSGNCCKLYLNGKWLKYVSDIEIHRADAKDYGYSFGSVLRLDITQNSKNENGACYTMYDDEEGYIVANEKHTHIFY